jgi:hypothetical protein
MLLIGQPKSASTSLMQTIAKMANVTPKNGQNKKNGDVKCKGFEEIQKYHGTTVQRSKQFLEAHIMNRTWLYKEHILPTNRHLKILNEINENIVVLLREPKGILNSYKRVFSVLPEVNNKINWNNLYKEIEHFYNTYRNLKNEKYLIVYFKDIVLNFHEEIKKIFKHYKLELPKNYKKFQLAKRNYTGHGIKEL